MWLNSELENLCIKKSQSFRRCFTGTLMSHIHWNCHIHFSVCVHISRLMQISVVTVLLTIEMIHLHYYTAVSVGQYYG